MSHSLTWASFNFLGKFVLCCFVILKDQSSHADFPGEISILLMWSGNLLGSCSIGWNGQICHKTLFIESQDCFAVRSVVQLHPRKEMQAAADVQRCKPCPLGLQLCLRADLASHEVRVMNNVGGMQRKLDCAFCNVETLFHVCLHLYYTCRLT